MKLFFTSVFVFFLMAVGNAQVPIAEYDRANNDPCVSAASFAVPNSTASTLCRTSATSQASGGDFNSNGWDATSAAEAVTNNEYYTFNFATNVGFVAEIVELNYRLDRSNSGPGTYFIRTSLDGFTADIAGGAISASGGNFSAPVSLSLGNGASVEIRIYAFGATGGSGTMDVEGTSFGGSATLGDPGIQLVGTVTSALPISLAKFDIEKTNRGDVQLNWTTASEFDNDFFVIEHSLDGQRFEAIAEVAGAGDSYQAIDYNFTHETPARGMNYYRLKQVDYSRAFSFSEVQSLRLAQENELQVWPTLIENATRIQLGEKKINGNLIVTTVQGQVILSKSLVNQEGAYDLDLSQVPNGAYILNLLTDGVQMNRRILIQK